MPSIGLALALWALIGWPGVALAQVPEVADTGEDIDLEALFNTEVEVATKRSQALAEAPAVVDVITAEDIRERGYQSVGEALRAIPGFYVVNDYFMPNIGVRGLPSGQRAWSRIVKVMIDGFPVSYRPEATNFLGPELLPMGLVKRIEVIRGPGSALYGADAFLGVINVVTKRGEDLAGASLTSRGGTFNGKGLADASLVGGAPLPWGDAEAASGAGFGFADRTGLSVPDQSPFSTKYSGQASANDLSWPGSFFGRLGNLSTPIGQLSIDGAYQHVSAGGEFQDWKAFTHASQVNLENRQVRAGLRSKIGSQIATSASLAVSRGAPGPADRISTGRTDYVIRRDMGSDGVDATVEGSYAFDQRNSLSLGADFSNTTHRLPTYYDVYLPSSPRAGEQVPDGPPGSTQTFNNLGLYGQGIVYFLEDTALTLGVRLDGHNVYGNVLNSRLGLVHPIAPGLNGKILYGSSFKAPSPQQLFGKPLVFGDILGNAELKPEQAQTVEAALIWSTGRQLELLTNAYYTHVSDRIGFVAQGANSKAVNQSQLDSVGLETELKWRWQILHGMLNLSLQKTASQAVEDLGAADEAQLAEAYPLWMVNAGVGAPLGPLPLGAFLEGRFVGAVPSTQSNYVANGLVSYELPAVAILDLTLQSKEWVVGDGTVSAGLKLENLLDTAFAQPGFGGIDYPGQGRTLWMRVAYAW